MNLRETILKLANEEGIKKTILEIAQELFEGKMEELDGRFEKEVDLIIKKSRIYKIQ